MNMQNIVSGLSKRSCVAKITAIVLLFFGINIYLSYATDSYCTLSEGFHAPAIDMATRNGRPVIGLIYELYYLSGLPNVLFYYISSALALVFLCISIFIYQGILERYAIRENIRIVLAFAAIANVFIIEYFMFIEKCGFTLAILLNVTAVYWTEKFFSNHQKRYYAFAVIAMLLAVFTYQGTIALFVILSIPFAMKQAKDFKHYILNGVMIGAAWIIPVLIDFLAFKFIFKSSRLQEKTGYVARLKEVLRGIINNGKETFNILPEYAFLIIIFIILAALIVDAIASRNCGPRIFNAIVIIISGCIFSTATILQGSGWWATRTVYPIASIPAVLAIDIFVNKEKTDSSILLHKTAGIVSMAAVSVLLICQYFSFNRIYIDKYQLNALDQYRYQYVGRKICEYQERTGNEITKIAFYNDVDRSLPQYSGLYCTGELVVSAFTTDWSDITAMNYYLGTSYEKISPVEKYVKYFSEKEWKTLSDEQFIFDGDTLHLCVY